MRTGRVGRDGSRLAGLVAIAFLTACPSGEEVDPREVLRGLALTEPYGRVRWLSSHNSYDKCGFVPCSPSWKDPLADQLAAGIRSFELDLHQSDDRRCDWDVAHVTLFGGCGDYCCSLRQCLIPFREFHEAHPTHEVVTIFLQLNDDWENGHFQEPGDLDAILEEYFNPGTDDPAMDHLFGPEDLRHYPPPGHPARGAPLSQVVTQYGWPTLGELAGKFIFVLMGNSQAAVWAYPTDWDHYGDGEDDTCDGGPPILEKYCFIAPDANGVYDIRDRWPGIEGRDATKMDVVFCNVHNEAGAGNIRAASTICATAYEAGMVSRIYKTDDQWQYDEALASFVHHIATDHVSREQFEPLMAFLQVGFACEPNR